MDSHGQWYYLWILLPEPAVAEYENKLLWLIHQYDAAFRQILVGSSIILMGARKISSFLPLRQARRLKRINPR